MATRSKKKAKAFQTFDPEDFDTHSLSHSIRSKIWPLQRGEKLVHLEKDLAEFKGKRRNEKALPRKSILVSVAANIVMPGLGNVYAYNNPFTLSILALSILVLIVTLSPLFPIVGLLGAANIAQPNMADGQIITLFTPSSVALGNQVLVGPTFSILLVPLLLAWLHLLYLLVSRSDKIEWTV